MKYSHLHLTVGQLLEMLSTLDPNKEIRYEYDSHSCSMHWLEIQEIDDYYEMRM